MLAVGHSILSTNGEEKRHPSSVCLYLLRLPLRPDISTSSECDSFGISRTGIVSSIRIHGYDSTQVTGSTSLRYTASASAVLIAVFSLISLSVRTCSGVEKMGVIGSGAGLVQRVGRATVKALEKEKVANQFEGFPAVYFEMTLNVE